MPSDKDRRSHTLADHQHGEGVLAEHVHGPDADHDHDDVDPGRLEDNPIFLADNVWLTSVGIDIGSSGTQVVFSRIHMRRLGEDLSSRYYVVSRTPLYQSPVALTPYRSEKRIDERALGEIIDAAYAAAGLVPADIDAGVVILTGEALRRDNAEAIAAIVAEQGGDFVCATAGHHMEAQLAAYGSGAAAASLERGIRVLNVDIGGGTTKFAIAEAGRVTATAALHIGGRLAVVEGGRIARLDPAGERIASLAGVEWRLGGSAILAELELVADWMADAILATIAGRPAGAAALWLTEPLPTTGPVDAIMFSGGVAEFIYQRERRDFGDLGKLFGEALARRIAAGALSKEVLPAGECIRATALGASEYSVQLSGNTIYVSDRRALLPRRNLQVLAPDFHCRGDIDPAALAAAIADRFRAFDLSEGAEEVALALRWRGAPSHRRLAAFAEGVRLALRQTIAAARPIYLVLDGDVAHMLGAILKEEMQIASEVLAIDGIVLKQFDYIDIGRIRLPSHTVPVTVKSLIFKDSHLHQNG
jgi:ethanolamine utilization protein EutA